MRSGKIAGPELLNIKREPAFLKKYLRQQIDLYGKRHPIAFTGSDQELDDIIARIKAQRN